MGDDNPNRAEAERLLGISEKLLESKDLNGSREFAILAQEAEPLLEGTDQILAVVDVLLAAAAENRVNNQPNWYQILQVDPHESSKDIALIKKQYRRLALLLHPDKNRFPFADQAFTLVGDSWKVLSDTSKKSQFDLNLNLIFTKVDLNKRNQDKEKLAQNRKFGTNERMATFWTACPYCYGLHEYPRVYEEYCVRCQNCKRAFHAASIPQLPPLVPGKDEYYCCWGFFPMGFVGGKGGSNGESEADTSKFPNWMPPMFSTQNGGDRVAPPTVPNMVDGWSNGGRTAVNGDGAVHHPPSSSVPVSFDGWSGAAKRNNAAVNSNGGFNSSDGMQKKRGRGRPRKNP